MHEKCIWSVQRTVKSCTKTAFGLSIERRVVHENCIWSGLRTSFLCFGDLVVHEKCIWSGLRTNFFLLAIHSYTKTAFGLSFDHQFRRVVHENCIWSVRRTSKSSSRARKLHLVCPSTVERVESCKKTVFGLFVVQQGRP